MPEENDPTCIAVTQLTSTSEEQMKKEQLIPVTLEGISSSLCSA